MAMSIKRFAQFRGRFWYWIIILVFVGTMNLWSRPTATTSSLNFSGDNHRSGEAPVDDTAAAEVVPVFYNLFIGPDTNYTRARDLVNEQLSLMLPEHEANIMAIGVV
jgi:hypothetical protein